MLNATLNNCLSYVCFIVVSTDNEFNQFAMKVDRKMVKQTVMTSVYGVTFIGAREQIRKRLKERVFGDDIDDTLSFRATCYAAKVNITYVHIFMNICIISSLKNYLPCFNRLP